MRGLITTEDYKELRPLFKSNKQIVNFLVTLWKKWIELIYKRVWIPRYKLIKEQKEELNITVKEKRSKRQKRKKRNKKVNKKGKENSPRKAQNIEKEKKQEKEASETKVWKIVREEVAHWINSGERASWWKKQLVVMIGYKNHPVKYYTT